MGVLVVVVVVVVTGDLVQSIYYKTLKHHSELCT